MAHDNLAIPASYQEALEALSRVADGNGNTFKLKLVRRPNAASTVTQHIATFGDATWQHIADAESWIAPFSGGGLYVLQVLDGKDQKKHYGQITPSEITGAPRPPNPNVTKSASWLGPVLLSSSADQPNGAGATALSPFTLAGEPWTGATGPRIPGDTTGLSSLFQSQQAEIGRKEHDLAERERRLEFERIRAESDARAKVLETRLADLVALSAKPQPPVPGIDLPSLVTGLLGAAAPIITAVLSSSAETRRAQVEIERTRMEREREDRKAQASRPLIDPQILEIMDRQAKRAEEQAAQFSLFLKAQAESARSNAESQSMAQRTMLQTIADVAQLQLKTTSGQDDPGIDWGKVVQGVAAGLGAFAQQKAGPGPGQAGAMTSMGQSPGLPAGQPAAAPLPEIPESEALNAVEDRIRAKDPPDQIVLDLKKAVTDPVAVKEIAALGGLQAVFEDRLDDFGSDKKNEKYMEALIAVLEKSGLLKL
jgi:hypothetical protein